LNDDARLPSDHIEYLHDMGLVWTPASAGNAIADSDLGIVGHRVF
jgi:hypothetical protein